MVNGERMILRIAAEELEEGQSIEETFRHKSPGGRTDSIYLSVITSIEPSG